MKTIVRLALPLLLLAGAADAWAQSTPITALPNVVAPADIDLFILEHVNGPNGQHTSNLRASDLATYIQQRLGLVPQVAGANTVQSGPVSGPAATPAFRALIGADLPQPSATTLGAVFSVAPVASQWVTSIGTNGQPTLAQPGFPNISGLLACGQHPALTGDVATASASCVTAIQPNAVTNADLRQSAPLALVGNAGAATANVADIVGTANQVPRVNPAGTALGFGALNLASTAAVTGALPVGNGGTGLASFAVGDLAVAPTTSTLQSLPDVATGNVLTSGGVGTLPAYGKVGLTTHVAGVLGVANGGTNCSAAAGSCVDNISGFAGTGFVERTGAGAYTFLADPVAVAHGGTGQTAAGALAANAIGAAATASNLSDLASASTARTNLGLGTAATQSAGSFAASTVTISSGAGLTGGGALTANQTLSSSRPVNAQTGTSYTIATSDQAKLVTLKNASAVSVSLPVFVAGYEADLLNLGAGTVTVTPASGMINGSASIALTTGQGAHVFSDGTNAYAEQGAAVGTGTGTVTSVASGGGLTGGPITSSGTLSLASFPMQGRLGGSFTPVLTASVSAASTIYYSPYSGDLVSLWNGSNFVATPFDALYGGQIFASLSGLSAGNVYDLFVWNNAGTVTLSFGPAWSAGATAGSNLVRGSGAGSTALSRVQGLLVNANAITSGPAAGYGTYVGTLATDAGGATWTWNTGSASAGGGAAVLNVWNMYNRVTVDPAVSDTTSSWTYATTATWRSADASVNNRITFVSGWADDGVSADYEVVSGSNSNAPNGSIGIGLNSTTSPAATTYFAAGTVVFVPMVAHYAGSPLLGQNYLQAIEYDAAGTMSFYVTANAKMLVRAQLRM